MTCLTIQEIKVKIKKSIEYQNKILDDINSNRPHSQKKYLKEFNKMLERERKRNNYYNHLQNCNGKEFFNNYYSPNNVIISGINHTNYIGNSSPSPF